jgi:hypothetical protein
MAPQFEIKARHRMGLPFSRLAEMSLRQLRELARGLGISRDDSTARDSIIEEIQRASPQRTEPVASVASPAEPVVSEAASSTFVVFLPRDPQWAYAFWEISEADRDRAAASGARELCLRVEDVTGLPLGAAHAHTRQEMVIDANGREWFLPIPMSGRDYRVELGYRLAAGGWLPLAVSAVAKVPSEGPSDDVADQFVPFSLEGPGPVATAPTAGGGVEHERLYRRAIEMNPIRRRVGSELLHEAGAEAGAERDLSDSGAGLWASGRSESGSGVRQPRSFWLVADAELIVYGATEPDATLFIGDEQVPLDEDGCFRVHVPFRDGQQLYPIRAVAADGEQERSISLEFTRETPSANVNTREEAAVNWF